MERQIGLVVLLEATAPLPPVRRMAYMESALRLGPEVEAEAEVERFALPPPEHRDCYRKTLVLGLDFGQANSLLLA